MTQSDSKRQKLEKKKWILNLHATTSPSLQVRLPAVVNFQSLNYWIKIAQLAESAKLHTLYIGDSLDLDESHFPKASATEYIAGLALSTKSIGFGVTTNTVSEHPYLYTRRIASLDHLSKGRIAWNIVSSFPRDVSRNFVLSDADVLSKEEEYLKSEDYLKVVSELLLSSWRDDALVHDAEREVWIETDRLRQIDHEGKFFTVPGPGLTEPTLQRIPYILQSDSSETGRHFSAKYAETVYLNGSAIGSISSQVRKIKENAEKFGRDPESIKFVTLVTIIVGRSHQEANAQYESVKKFVDSKKFGAVIIGDAVQVADELQRWADLTGIDGFNFNYAISQENFENIVELLIPELQRRGLAQTEYTSTGATLRENINFEKGANYLTKDHPLYDYRWFQDQTQQQFEEKLEALKKTDLPVN